MFDAGLLLLRCLDILSSPTIDSAFLRAQLAVKKEIKGSRPLAATLNNQSHCLYSVLCDSKVRAAEAGGTLNVIRERLATFLERELEIRKKVKTVLPYPVLVLIFGAVMLIAISIIVLPTFSNNLPT